LKPAQIVAIWLVVVQYDQGAHETLQAAIAQDAECQQAFAEIAKFATRISRELAHVSFLCA
jgi:hypothetical protein